ncbi:MAG: hypothetical protein ACLTMP_04240 [Eggerthella lenta]
MAVTAGRRTARITLVIREASHTPTPRRWRSRSPHDSTGTRLIAQCSRRYGTETEVAFWASFRELVHHDYQAKVPNRSTGSSAWTST